MERFFLTLVLLSSSSLLISHAFIIPQEVPSLLSLIYSNIPPIRKGTDSRIGFGYRLGDHADFQVQFEIGPQKDTQAIGTGSTNKRATSSSDSYKAEREANREAYKEKAKQGSWLQNWFGKMQQNEKEAIEEKTRGNNPTQPSISEDAFNQLKELYKKTEVEENSELKETSSSEQSATETII